jgi:hypothetical protein
MRCSGLPGALMKGRRSEKEAISEFSLLPTLHIPRSLLHNISLKCKPQTTQKERDTCGAHVGMRCLGLPGALGKRRRSDKKARGEFPLPTCD